MGLSLQFKRQLFITDIKSIDINHIKWPFFPDYQSLSPCRTLQSHLPLKCDKRKPNKNVSKTYNELVYVLKNILIV